MQLSKADPANCGRAILSIALRRWLWLMPNPTAPHFLRVQEPWSLPAESARPGHSVNTRSCNVGLIQPKTFQVPVTDLYIFINIDLEIGPVMHVLCPGCSLNSSPSLRGRRARTWASSMSCQGDVGILPEPSRSCSSASGAAVCCGSCFRLVC